MARPTLIPHSRPTIGKKEHSAVTKTLKSGFITRGAEVEAFEKEMAKRHGVTHAVATNSGVSALHLALEALNVRDGEVVIPSYVCSAVLNAVQLAGATAVITDVERDTYNIDPKEVEKALSDKTRAVIVPHMFGLPARIKEILKYRVPVIEDCAMALGASLLNSMGWIRGDAAVFSFYGTKMIATGQGGMLLTRHKKFIDIAKDLTSYDNRLHYRLRYNYHMTDIVASIGRVQFRRLGSFVLKRQALARTYTKAFLDLPIGLPPGPETGHIYFRYNIELPRGTRKNTIQKLAALRIETKPAVFKALHRYMGFSRQDYPVTESFCTRVLSLPIYPSLKAAEQARVISAVRRLFK